MRIILMLVGAAVLAYFITLGVRAFVSQSQKKKRK